MCQEADENNPLIQRILEVLYATEVRIIIQNYLNNKFFFFP